MIDVDWDDSETPTQPPAPEATAAHRISWMAANEAEARQLDEIVKAWLGMTTDQRVIVSAICREFWQMG